MKKSSININDKLKYIIAREMIEHKDIEPCYIVKYQQGAYMT